MKAKFSLSLVILLLPFLVFSQGVLTKEQVLEDYVIFKNILTSGHPALYEYTSPKEWDSLFSNFETKEITHSDAFFTATCALAQNVRDGHLSVLHPKMERVPALFPLLLKAIDNKLYTDTDDFGIPIGAEITSINGIASQAILKDLLKYAPSDGYNLSKKFRQIEKEFGILHYYQYGSSRGYSVKYKTLDGDLKTIDLVPASFESIGKRYVNRNSHFAAYHQETNSAAFFQTRIAEKWPFVYYIDSINTAVLTVNSFGLDPKEFKSRLIDLFKEIKKKKASNLIIDIRQNNGGYRANAISLFSFLTEEPFKQRVSQSTITDVLPYEEHIVHSMSDYGQFFEMYFANAMEESERWILAEDHAQAEMIPVKKPFQGKAYVLIGGNTFSAGSAFALNAKNTEEITLIGEETGGGYYFHTAQYLAVYELPNSKVMVRVPFVKVNKYVTDLSIPKGSGIVPDVVVTLTVRDLIDGKDSQLDYVLKIAEE